MCTWVKMISRKDPSSYKRVFATTSLLPFLAARICKREGRPPLLRVLAREPGIPKTCFIEIKTGIPAFSSVFFVAGIASLK